MSADVGQNSGMFHYPSGPQVTCCLMKPEIGFTDFVLFDFYGVQCALGRTYWIQQYKITSMVNSAAHEIYSPK